MKPQSFEKEGGADDRVLDGGTSGAACGGGCGEGPFAVDPASLLGWHHTLHEFSHEFRPIAFGARRLPPSWEAVAPGTVGPKDNISIALAQ